MKNVLRCALFSCAAAWFPCGALAGQISSQVGFVHFRNALQGTNEAKAEIDQVQQYVDEMNQESNRRFERLDQLREELRTKGPTLTADALAQLQSDVQEAEAESKRFQEDTQHEIDRRRDAIFREYGQKLQDVIVEYAQSNGYDVVFLLDNSQYAYLDPMWDLTERIAAAYNQQHPDGGGSLPSR